MVLAAPRTVKIFSLYSPECQAAGHVPRRTAALSRDNNPANQFVSDSSKYMRIAPYGLDFDCFEPLAASSRRLVPGDEAQWGGRLHGLLRGRFSPLPISASLAHITIAQGEPPVRSRTSPTVPET
jgi:hypothetical protein